MALGPDLIEKYPLLSALADPLKPAARKIVGREHEKRQLLAALSRPELCNALLLAEAGTGKCHPVNTTIAVLDDRGYIEMNQLRVGDLVADEHGGPTQVEAIYDSGLQELVAVTLADETTLLCNPGHLLDVCTQATRGVKNRWRTIEVKDLIDQLYVGGKPNVFLPRGKALNRPFNGAAANPYVLGVVIADGLHRSNSKIKVKFSGRISPAIVERVTNELSQAGSYRTTDDGYVLVGKNGGELWADGLYHRHISDAFELGSEQQYIPDVYINASIEQRLDLLRGLFDVAGVRLDQGGRNRFIGWAIETKSVMLAKQVQKLATSLNIRCSVVEDEGTYYIQLYLYQDELDHISWASKGFRKVTQRMVWYLDQAGIGSDDIAILAISETKVKVPMMCIKVSNPTHLYQVGTEHIVTHNTALVQATMLEDTKRLYLEVDPSRMLAYAKTPENMAATLKAFFDEAEQYYRCEKHELVLFIDEFHQIIQLSDAAVEAIKPVLAASGARGIRIIAATTYEEFHRYIANNIPLVERLQRINLNPPDKETTVLILSGMAERYGVTDQFNDDRIFQQIYEYTQRYMPASSQPRKSILVLDSMVGWHRLTGKKMDRHLLADVLEESAGVNVAFKVDGSGIKKALDQKVFSQDLATTAVSKRLQLAVADLNDKSKPMASLLFTGSTGVGKTELVKQLSNLLFGDNQRHLIRFDMTEYSEDSSLQIFRSELTKRVWDRPHSVVLFDEVEKASQMVTRILLQVLDDGRLSDDNGREISFLNTYIVLTTNAGSEVYRDIAQYAADDTGSGKQLKEYDKLIRRSISTTTGDNRFPPELLGRIDAIVPFQPLSLATQKKIVTKKLADLIKEIMVKHNTKVDISRRVLQYLIEDKGDTDSDAGGARGAVAKMTAEVTTEIAAFINAHPYDKHISVDVVGDLVSDDKTLRTSDAYIKVSAVKSY